MALYTGCVYDGRQYKDYFRICITGWLTDDKGNPVEDLYKRRLLDSWEPTLAPDLKETGAFKRGELSWEAFSGSYKERLQNNGFVASRVADIGARAYYENIILLCSEPLSQKTEDLECHRRLLAEHIKGKFSDLEVVLEKAYK